MRKTILSSFVLLTGLAASLEAGVNYWTAIGPFGGEIAALAADAQQGSVIFAAARGGVFKSANGGVTWRRTSRGLQGSSVNDVAVAPSNRNVVYAATFNGLFVSRDGGETWVNPRPKLDQGVLSVAVDPRDARHVWAGTQFGVAWSHDAGVTWSYDDLEEPSSSRVPDIVIDPVHPDTVYAANEPVEDESILGVMKTTDGGATWTFLGQGLDGLLNAYDSMRLAVDPTAPNVVYVSSNSAGSPPYTFRSADGGATWSETPGGYPVAVDRRGVTYAGGLRSLDHGATWQPMATPPRETVDYLALDGTLWAATYSSGVFRSNDRGATWKASSDGLHATTVTSVAVDPDQPRVIYAATTEIGVRKTLSSGERWRPANAGLPILSVIRVTNSFVAVDSRQPRTVYYAGNQKLARSDDGGDTWTVLEAAGAIDPFGLLVDAAGSVYLTGSYLLDGNCRMARSDDRGQTFHCLPPFTGIGSWPPLYLFLDPARPGTLWVLEQRDRLWKSADRGEHWTEIHAQGLEHAGDPRSLAIDPANPARLYLGTNRAAFDDRPERVWRSDDGGLTWRPWGSGMPAASWVTDLVMDRARPSIFYAAVAHQHDASRSEADLSGVFWSRDGGRTFVPLRDGMPAGRVLDLAQDPRDPRKIYAATLFNGVYTFTRK